MSIPELIPPGSRFSPELTCELADRWQISDVLATRLRQLAARLEFPITIISGFRTAEEQLELGRAGRPAAPVEVSTHTSCPATGADLMPTIAVTNVVKARLGAEAVLVGLRWGGGSPVDPETGIPSDWNHVDLGPRSTS